MRVGIEVLEAEKRELEALAKQQKKALGELKVRFDLEKQAIYKDTQKNIENQRNVLELEHQNKVAEIRIKMGRTFDHNRNYLINKYTKEIDDLKTGKGGLTRAGDFCAQEEEPEPGEGGQHAGERQVQPADAGQGTGAEHRGTTRRNGGAERASG